MTLNTVYAIINNNMNEKSKYQQLEETTRHYYGADTDMLKFVPTATDKETAHELALMTERYVAHITPESIGAEAIRVLRRNKMIDPKNAPSIEALTDQSVKERLETAVVNIELTHARLSPQDFNEDSRQSGAYELSAHLKSLDTPPSEE